MSDKLTAFTQKDARKIKIGDVVRYRETRPRNSRLPNRDELVSGIIIQRDRITERRSFFGILTADGELRLIYGHAPLHYSNIFEVIGNVVSTLPSPRPVPWSMLSLDARAVPYRERRQRLRALQNPDHWNANGALEGFGTWQLSCALNPLLERSTRRVVLKPLDIPSLQEAGIWRRHTPDEEWGFFMFDLLNLLLLLDNETLDAFLDKE